MNDPMDGLAALDAKRKSTGRRLPPPRNAPRTQPVVAPAPTTVETSPVVESPPAPKPVAPVPPPAPKVAEVMADLVLTGQDAIPDGFRL